MAILWPFLNFNEKDMSCRWKKMVKIFGFGWVDLWTMVWCKIKAYLRWPETGGEHIGIINERMF